MSSKENNKDVNDVNSDNNNDNNKSYYTFKKNSINYRNSLAFLKDNIRTFKTNNKSINI